jgi:hypothetical protein
MKSESPARAKGEAHIGKQSGAAAGYSYDAPKSRSKISSRVEGLPHVRLYGVRSRGPAVRGVAAFRLSELWQWIDHRRAVLGEVLDLASLSGEIELAGLTMASCIGLPVVRRLEEWCAKYAPEALDETGELPSSFCMHLETRAAAAKGMPRADEAAKMIRLDFATRQALAIKTIGAIDFDRAARKRRRNEEKRIREAERRAGMRFASEKNGTGKGLIHASKR